MKKRFVVAGAVFVVVAFGLFVLWGNWSSDRINREARNLDSEVVRIEISGHNFDIPMRSYMDRRLRSTTNGRKQKKTGYLSSRCRLACCCQTCGPTIRKTILAGRSEVTVTGSRSVL